MVLTKRFMKTLITKFRSGVPLSVVFHLLIFVILSGCLDKQVEKYKEIGKSSDNSSTVAASDTTPPTKPTSLTLTGDSCLYQTDATSWTASTDSGGGVSYYQMAISTSTNISDIISGGGFSSSVVTGTSAQFTTELGLSAGTNYYSLVRAVDAAGNKSNHAVSASWQIPNDNPSAFLTGTETTEAGTPTNFNQATAYPIVWSASSFASCHFSHSLSVNPEQLSITHDGDYFISVTIPLTLSDVNGIRRAVSLDVLVNGVSVSQGRGDSGYIRQGSGHAEASVHIATLLNDLSAGDYIEVKAIQEASIGTVTTSSASLYVEYVKPSRSIFFAKGSNTVGGSGFNLAAADAITWTEVKEDTDFTHSDSVSPENITINTAGDYLITANLPLFMASCDSKRRSSDIKIKLDGVTIAGGTGAQGYIRCAESHDSATVHFSGVAKSVMAGQVLTVTAQAGTTITTGALNVIAGTEASIMIEKISSADNILTVRGNRTVASTDWNSTAVGSAIEWATQDTIDATEFTHSVGVNPQNITLVTGGDYLVYYNDHLTSAAQRPNVVISLKVNGTPVTGAECKSQYIRITEGHDESSCSMVYFLNDMTASSTLTIEAKKEAVTGVVNDASDALLTIIKK